MEEMLKDVALDLLLGGIENKVTEVRDMNGKNCL